MTEHDPSSPKDGPEAAPDDRPRPEHGLRSIAERIRGLSPGLFGVMALCFLLPFFSVMCSGSAIVTLKGLDFVIGGTAEVDRELEKSIEESFLPEGFQDLSDEESGETTVLQNDLVEDEEVEPNLFVILAAVGVVAGLVLGLVLRSARRDLLLTICAGSVIAGLLLFRLDAGADADVAPGVSIKYRYGYWLLMLLAVAVGAAHFEGHRRERSVEDDG